MNVLSRYWKICRISLTKERVGYEYSLVAIAQKFCRQTVSDSLHPQSGDIQATLNSYFYAQNSAINLTYRAVAGLCLRCYVSYPILKACQKIDSLFAGDKSFTYRDLLPFVLNDDGQTRIVLDRDGKTQLILDDNGQTKTTAYQFFSVKVLQTYKHDDQSSMSLDNWAYLQTKQNRELKNFLSEFGFKALSDWALLNRARTKQLERLSIRDRHLVEVFHAVYRRDRRKQRHKGAKRCPEPNEAQLREMLAYLQEKKIVIDTTVELMKALKQLATQLRQYDIWSYREPLEIQEPNTGSYVLRPDLPHDSNNEVDVEQQEFLQFLHQKFQLALVSAIEQEIRTSIAKLQKSKRYAPLASRFILGLQLYYCQGKSLKEIFPQLGMTSWDQARRVLNPGGLLSRVRTSSVQQLLDSILKKAEAKGLTKIPPEPDYLKTLAEQIEAFADEEVFQEAAAEIKTGKNRSLKSLYAQQLQHYCEQHI
ncbi:hypothetical protein [Pleurocapsa sp. PCC 7319]|uniref:hypothetical protein n=1 Tax=Pleurocapsa sp. PCC 7319 TaxID=118161 RepID=UPI000345C03C|nr:hypothetical protein [Pleurocapsa sp. PCC 7319]